MLGQKLSNAASIAIYDKALKVSMLADKSISQGTLINLMQVDAEKLSYVPNMVLQLFFLPIQIVISVVIMYN